MEICIRADALVLAVLFERLHNFVAYLNRLRIDKACEYLRTANIKIHEISGLVGYRDSQYFYRVFKKYTGCTPIEYRMNEK